MDRFYIQHFAGGMNQSVDKSLIKFTETQNAQNCNIDDGVLNTVKGSVKYTPAVLSYAIKTIMASYANGTGELIAAANNKLYKLSGSTYTAFSNTYTSDTWDYINFQIKDTKVLITGNGTDNTMVYDNIAWRKLLDRRVINEAPDSPITYKKADGTTTTGIPTAPYYSDGNGVYHQAESTITTYAPKVKHVELHYDRVWGAGDSSFPDRLYFSTAGVNGADPDDWTAPIEEGEANMHGGYEDIPTWDGGKIIGLKVVFNDLLVFKNRQVFKIFGSYPGNYTKVQLFNSNGAIADRSIVTTPKGALFLNTDGIYMYGGANVTLISDRIKDIIKNLNQSAIGSSTGIYFNGKYYLAVPEGNTYNSTILVYNLNTNVFSPPIRGVNVNQFVEFNNQLLYVTNNGTLCQLETGTNFDGTSISTYYETVTTDLGAMNAKKMTDYLYFTGRGNGDVKFTLTMYDKKGKVKTKIKQVTLTQVEMPYAVKMNCSGRSMMLRIENVNGSEIHIKKPEMPLEIDVD